MQHGALGRAVAQADHLDGGSGGAQERGVQDLAAVRQGGGRAGAVEEDGPVQARVGQQPAPAAVQPAPEVHRLPAARAWRRRAAAHRASPAMIIGITTKAKKLPIILLSSPSFGQRRVKVPVVGAAPGCLLAGNARPDPGVMG
ncbi:hypothetical protein ACFQ1I_02395 [Kitasatospora arboriphila]